MKLKSFTVENTWLEYSPHGWGNGYVAVPPKHPLHGMDYDKIVKVKDENSIKFNENWIGLLCYSIGDRTEGEIPLNLAINVHGGITLARAPKDMKYVPSCIPSDWWVFGFDTCHADDDILSWPKERVRSETKKFKRELENIDKILA